MEQKTIEVLVCPACRGKLSLPVPLPAAILIVSLHCTRCGLVYPVIDGIPHFLKLKELTGLNRKFAHLYDRFSVFYRLFLKVAFTCIGMKEEIARKEILDRLEPKGGRQLEVSVGPGVNLPYLVHRPDVGELFGLDISLGQLSSCQRLIRRKNWKMELFLGNAENLPFNDDTFDAVFHIGGINFFNNKKAAIEEMIRVAKPGTQFLISDESEKGARGFDKYIPGFKQSAGRKRTTVVPPIDLVPPEMLDIRLSEVWKGWMYCLEFRKP